MVPARASYKVLQGDLLRCVLDWVQDLKDLARCLRVSKEWNTCSKRASPNKRVAVYRGPGHHPLYHSPLARFVGTLDVRYLLDPDAATLSLVAFPNLHHLVYYALLTHFPVGSNTVRRVTMLIRDSDMWSRFLLLVKRLRAFGCLEHLELHLSMEAVLGELKELKVLKALFLTNWWGVVVEATHPFVRLDLRLTMNGRLAVDRLREMAQLETLDVGAEGVPFIPLLLAEGHALAPSVVKGLLAQQEKAQAAAHA